jgi:hypothetical protein
LALLLLLLALEQQWTACVRHFALGTLAQLPWAAAPAAARPQVVQLHHHQHQGAAAAL